MQKLTFTVNRGFYRSTFNIECREYLWSEPSEIRQGVGDWYVLSRTIAGHDVRSRAVEFCGKRAQNKISAGPLIFMPKGDPIHFEVGPGRLISLVCRFEPATFERIVGLDKPVSHAETANLLALRSLRIDQIMAHLQAELESPGFSGDVMIEALCTSLMVEFGRLRHHRALPMPGKRRAVDIEAVKRYISKNAGRGVSITDIARMSGTSETHLMRCFKEVTGDTIHSFFSRVRLRQAEELLIATSWSMKQIAYNLGFASPSNFAAAFRKSKGESPTLFRTRCGRNPS
jgi:AraC family transcriptional regulator